MSEVGLACLRSVVGFTMVAESAGDRFFIMNE